MTKRCHQLADKLNNKQSHDFITAAVSKREHILTKNQTKMLNSLLNRTPNRITLDRLVFVNENQDEEFTHDSVTIGKKATTHFQTLGDDPVVIKANYSHIRSFNDLPPL